MGMRAAVAGASGYAGGELVRRLLGHPALEVGPLTASSFAGRPVTDAHPHLAPLAGTAFAATDPDVLAEADIVFLALPHGESAAVAARLPAHVKVVDIGADHRLRDASSWERFYGGAHAGAWTYGLPELPGTRDAVAGATRVANPGCFPTSVVLGLAPLLGSRAVEGGDVVVVSASGTSGAGRRPVPGLLGSEVMGSVSAYKAGGVHQHTPEMEQALGDVAGAPVTVSFTPTLAPMPRGILSTCTARLRTGVTGERLRAALGEAYDDEPFVHLLPAGSWPATGSTYGSNGVQIGVAADEHSGRAVVVVAIDNLGKGAAGQALQNANLMLGLPETAGLSGAGVAP